MADLIERSAMFSVAAFSAIPLLFLLDLAYPVSSDAPSALADAQLEDVVVVGQRVDPRVTVTVSGDVSVRALVRSDPVGVRCGAGRYQYEAYASPRLCWIRRPAGSEIVFRAEGLGADSFHWSGCTPGADPLECRLTMSADEAH
ncbi:hypothetical protein LTR94_028842, partial [Friedmanniomyces endolithicus]